MNANHLISRKKIGIRSVLAGLLLTIGIGANAQITTYSDVAPILYDKCAQCHRPGGGAPFSILDYDEAVMWLGAIGHEVTENAMPPWGPDTSYMHFVGERGLTAPEKAAILDWVADLGPEGDTTLLPPTPSFPPTLLHGTPDLIVNMPTLVSNATTDDAYNTVVFPIGNTQDRYIRAIEIIPADPELTHHIIVNADSAGAVTSDLSGTAVNIEGDIAVGGYQPGANPIVFPNTSILKMGIKIPANAEFVLQLHTPQYASMGATAGLDVDCEIRLYLYPPGETGVRDVYSETPLQYWGFDFILDPEEIQTFSDEYNTNGFGSDVSVFSSLPHSHYICTKILNYAYQGTDTIPLNKIDFWDFEHQEYYYYRNLVHLPMGYTLHADHTYENTSANHHNPFSPPQTITVGLATFDEMLFDSFQFIEYQPGDELINVDSILSNDPLYVGIGEYDHEFIKSYVAPNPMAESAQIFFAHPGNSWRNYQLEVLNIEGKRVNMEYKVDAGTITINRGDAASGMYTYRIMSEGQPISVGKLVLE